MIELLVFIAIAIAAVKAVERTKRPKAVRGTEPVRRFFAYTVLFGVVMLVATGMAGLLAEILPAGGDTLTSDPTAVARPLAFLIVGGPVLVAVWRWLAGRLDDPSERDSLGWSFATSATALVSVVVAGSSIAHVLQWAVGVEDHHPWAVAASIVFGATWLLAWQARLRYPSAVRGEGHVLVASAGGLLALVAALTYVLALVFRLLYDELTGRLLAGGGTDDLLRAGPALLVTAAIWAFYWLRHGIRSPRTPLWLTHTLLIGTLGALLTVVGTATAALLVTLIWFAGDPTAATAAGHFETMPSLAAGLLVGGATFLYHRRVLADRPGDGRSEVRRIYEYLVAAVGLVATAAGITVLFVALIRRLVPSPSLGESNINVLLGAVTFLVVGGPMWWFNWTRSQRMRSSQPDAELRSTARRTYVTTLLGVGSVTALISLITVTFTVLTDALDGTFGAATIDAVAPAFALVLTTGIVGAYHWIVFREDRAQAPAALRSPLAEVVIIGLDPGELVRSIPHRFDAVVRVWDRLDRISEPVADQEVVLEALADQATDRVAVVVGPTGVEVIPFSERRTGAGYDAR